MEQLFGDEELRTKEQSRNETRHSDPSSGPASRSAPRHSLLRLQRAVGNQATLRYLQRKCSCGGTCSNCQNKTALPIGPANDSYEHEADQNAARVMRMSSDSMSVLQRKCASCEEEENQKHKLQRQEAAPGPDVAPPIVHEVLSSPGSPLDFAARQFMEPHFGHDFSGVRVHADAKAADSARSVGALAYTLGNNIVFGPGQYAPQSDGGRRLLAHELTHVVQQDFGKGVRGIQRLVVDDNAHVTCRGTRTDAVTRLRNAEQTAITQARQAAAAIRSYVPATNASGETAASRTFRELLWRRFQLDYNDTQARCTILPELASRFERIADHITNDVHRYICGAPGHEPQGSCTSHPNEGNAWSDLGGDHTDFCESSWNESANDFVDTLMHEWFHCIFWVSDCKAINVENAECYPEFAGELAGTTTSANYAWCCRPPAGALPPLTVTAEAARNCSPPGRTALELFGGASFNQGLGSGTTATPPAVGGAVSLGLRYSLRSDRLIVVNPLVGAHLLYLPADDRNGAHLLAALAEFGVRFQQLNVPLRGVYFDVRLGAYTGLDIPTNRPGAPPASTRGLVGASGALGLGYRWERVELGVQARDMIDTMGTNHVVVLGGGALVF